MIATLAMNLDDQTLQDIQKLEDEIGCPILAFSPKGVEPAELDENALAKVKELEKKNGLSLVAVRS